MLIFAGIDGTGAGCFANDPHAYHPVYHNSHVSKLSRYAVWGRASHYVRGPGLFGTETAGLATVALAHVMQWRLIEPNSKVFLAGFSRGGAGAIEVAKWLKDRGIPVECLILFDPVDRSHYGGVGEGIWDYGKDTPIVDTVSHCIKVLRHPAAESRECFGNCGAVYESGSTQRYETLIYATHGGVGGTPWDPSYVPSGSIYIDEGKLPNGLYLRGVPLEAFEPDGMTKVTPAQDRSGSEASWSFVTGILGPIIDRAQIATGDSLTPERTEGYEPVRTVVPVLANHTVMPGESLSLISMKYYGTFLKWEKIYDVNRSTIGLNPHLITPKMELIIPKL